MIDDCRVFKRWNVDEPGGGPRRRTGNGKWPCTGFARRQEDGFTVLVSVRVRVRLQLHSVFSGLSSAGSVIRLWFK
jgi:hypothetical protein